MEISDTLETALSIILLLVIIFLAVVVIMYINNSSIKFTSLISRESAVKSLLSGSLSAATMGLIN